jgi:transcription antitermination factor NusG
MFILLEPHRRWAVVNSTYGVIRLLTRKTDKSEYLQPCTVSDDFIAGLQQCSNHGDPANHKGHNGVWLLEPGTKVKLISGPLAGHEGEIIAWRDDARVQLLVTMMNRPMTIITRGDNLIEIG